MFPAGLSTWTLRIKTKRKIIAAQLGLLMATAPITVRVSFTPYLSFITSVCCIFFCFTCPCVFSYVHSRFTWYNGTVLPRHLPSCYALILLSSSCPQKLNLKCQCNISIPHKNRMLHKLSGFTGNGNSFTFKENTTQFWEGNVISLCLEFTTMTYWPVHKQWEISWYASKPIRMIQLYQ